MKVLVCVYLFVSLSLSSINPANKTNAQTIENLGYRKQELDELIHSNPSLKGAITGISIRSSSTGNILYEHLGDTRLIPASNLKLFTAAAALSILGEEHTFTTEVHIDGKVKRKVLIGNLYLKGKGDPTLLMNDFEKIANEIRKKGIKVVQGDLVGDDTWFDKIRYSVDLPWSDEQTYYGAQVSALTASPDKDYDSGTALITIKPARFTRLKGKMNISPRNDYVQIENNTKTIPSKKRSNIKMFRDHGSNRIIVTGNIPLKHKPIKETLSVWNPTSYALHLFNQALKNNGIEVKGKIKEGKISSNTTTILVHQSIPLSKLLIPFMKLSNNGHAEVLVKEMGKIVRNKGSWKEGIKVMKKEIETYGVSTGTLVIRDGSGISHINLVPANEITQLLFAIQKEKWFPTYLRALPVGGESERMVGGTLRNRMKAPSLKGKIIAKTGSLTTVSTLSGYIKTKRGETLIFSILLNHLKDEQKGKAIEDEIVSILNH